jgi:hypothetical protein
MRHLAVHQLISYLQVDYNFCDWYMEFWDDPKHCSVIYFLLYLACSCPWSLGRGTRLCSSNGNQHFRFSGLASDLNDTTDIPELTRVTRLPRFLNRWQMRQDKEDYWLSILSNGHNVEDIMSYFISSLPHRQFVLSIDRSLIGCQRQFLRSHGLSFQ